MKLHLKSSIVLLIALAGLLLLARCSAVDREAKQRLMARIGNVSVTVYPTVIRQSGVTYDTSSSETIAAELKERNWATPFVSSDQVAVASGWRMNQSRLFRESAQALAKHVRMHNPRTDYGLMAEYLMGPDRAGGIHCYVVDQEGRLAAGVGLNSHHKLFADADPRSVEDCTKVLLTALDAELSKYEKKDQ